MKTRKEETPKGPSTGQKVLKGIAETATSVANEDAPNWKVAAAASGMSFLNMLVSAAAGDTVNYYLSMISAAGFAGVSANQAGLLGPVKSKVTSFGLFGGTETEKPEAKELELNDSLTASPVMGR